MCSPCRGDHSGPVMGTVVEPAGTGSRKGPCDWSLLSPVVKAQEILQAIRGYVRFFFGCRACAGHFEQMATDSVHQVGNLSSSILWFWSSHNKVNARLAGKEGPASKAGVTCRGRMRRGSFGVWDQRQESGPSLSSRLHPVFHGASQHPESFHVLCQPC